MKKKTRLWLNILLAAVFVCSTVLLLRGLGDNSAGQEDYGDAIAIASGVSPEATQPATEATTQPTEPETVWIPAPVEDDPMMEEMAAIDLASLRAVNQDVVGWIRIPKTKIDYPLMQGEDNEHYLKHTWKGGKNIVGSIFLESLNSPDLTDYNTIIYGHNMSSGAMFAGLHKFRKQDYWEAHPYVYITTDAGVYRYEIFSSYRAEVESPAYGLSFNQMKTRTNFLQHSLESSVIDTGIQPEIHDRIVTLSTCSGAGYSNRWVVQARLKMVEVLK